MGLCFYVYSMENVRSRLEFCWIPLIPFCRRLKLSYYQWEVSSVCYMLQVGYDSPANGPGCKQDAAPAFLAHFPCVPPL